MACEMLAPFTVATRSPPVTGAAQPAPEAQRFDLADRRQLRAEVERTQRLLDLAVEAQHLGCWEWDLRADTVEYDRRWPALLGYGPAEVQATILGWAALVHPDDVHRVTAEIEAHLHGRAPHVETEYRLRARDGGWRWMHSRARVTARDAGGRALRLTGTIADVTSRREADERVREALAQHEHVVAELQEALQRVRALSGVLPICAWCCRIRNDEGRWQRIEAYVAERSEARFSHGMCPECYSRHFPP